jgi:hypothetical protein
MTSGICFKIIQWPCVSHRKTWQKLKFILQIEKKPMSKGYLLCNSNPRTFWKRQNNGDSEKAGVRVTRGKGGGGAPCVTL